MNKYQAKMLHKSKQYFTIFFIKLILILLFTSSLSSATTEISNENEAEKYSAVYGGGPFYFGGQATMDDLKFSGITTVIFWTLHIGENGELIFNDIPIVADGEYIGRPGWPAEIASLKQAPTGINRIQFGVASAGVEDFQRIDELISEQGTGPDSILFRNFDALKKAIPEIDAIDFDDESHYRIPPTVRFSLMLAKLGYQVTFVPFTNQEFWRRSYRKIELMQPGVVDRVYIQGYAGGASNQPSLWNGLFGDLNVSMGLWTTHGSDCQLGDSPEEFNAEFINWNEEVDGGFIWIYDDLLLCLGRRGMAEYANAINNALNIDRISASVAENPSPNNDAIAIDLATDLTWQAGFNAISHDLYLGTTAELGAEDFIGNLTDLSFQPVSLAENTTYYWRVDEHIESGIIPGDTWRFTTQTPGMELIDRTDEPGATISARGENLPNEGVAQAFDNNPQTKWLDFAASTWVQYQFPNDAQYAITQYAFTSANDSPIRDPSTWILEGSNDGINWITLDSQADILFSSRFQTQRFDFENNTPYSHFRFTIDNVSGGITQIGEIELLEFIRVADE